MLIDRRFFQYLVNAGQNVAKISVAEVFDVGAGKDLALPVTAARVGLKDKYPAAERATAKLCGPGQVEWTMELGPPWTLTTMGYFFAGSKLSGYSNQPCRLKPSFVQ